MYAVIETLDKVISCSLFSADRKDEAVDHAVALAKENGSRMTEEILREEIVNGGTWGIEQYLVSVILADVK